MVIYGTVHLCYKGSQVKNLNNNIIMPLKFAFSLANSADPDEMPPYAAFHLGFVFLLIPRKYRVNPLYIVELLNLV